MSLFIHLQRLCIGDGDFDLDAGLDADGGDLLDDLRWTVQINQTLVDPHLEAIPGLGSFATGGFSGGDAQSLRKSKTPDFSRGQNKNTVYDTALGSRAGPVYVLSTTDLCWHADRSLHLQVLLFSPSDQVSTDCGLRSKAHTRSRHIS